MNKKDITIEQIKELYINQGLSKENTAKKLGVCLDFVNRRLKANNIQKTKEQIQKDRLNTTEPYFNKLKEDLYLDRAPKEKIYKYYIEENHTYKETQNQFGISDYKLYKLLKEYNIHKSKKVSAQIGINTKHKQYGSKEAYDKHINNLIKKTKEERYGSLENYNKIISNKCKEAWNLKSPEEQKNLIDKIINTGGGWNYNKIKKTVKEKYNVNNISQLPDIKKRKKISKEKTCLEKYGVPNVLLVPEIREKIHKTLKERYGVDYIGQNLNIKQKVKETNLKRYGVEWACLRKECLNFHKTDSKPNLKFKEKLENNNIKFEREFVIGNLSYDFKIDNNLIEIDPWPFHNASWTPIKNGEPKSKDYHFNKSKIARENGYRCIHIWDWDNIDKIISMLKPREHIGARECKTQLVKKEDAIKFINENHLQGYTKDEIRIGLYYRDELVSIMTFGKPRYNKNYEYELIRYCSNKLIIGGANKLFRYFLDNYKPKSIISYCDLSKFTGQTYEKLGMKLKRISISKHWYNPITEKHILDSSLLKQGFDRLLGKEYGCYGKGKSNEQLMLDHDFVEIYDAGQATYIYE